MGQKERKQMALRGYPERFKKKVVEYYLKEGCTKQYAWQKFTGYAQEHGTILRWMRQLGYISEVKTRQKLVMEPGGNKLEDLVENERIRELERRLKEAELKAIAYSKMIDIAEEELKISIRKKYSTKPSK